MAPAARAAPATSTSSSLSARGMFAAVFRRAKIFGSRAEPTENATSCGRALLDGKLEDVDVVCHAEATAQLAHAEESCRDEGRVSARAVCTHREADRVCVSGRKAYEALRVFLSPAELSPELGENLGRSDKLERLGGLLSASKLIKQPADNSR
eukprot:6177610-Pleurochrysis_carterae.AAC.4